MDANELNNLLSDNVESLMQKHFPDAQRKGNTYTMGDLKGSKGTSTNVFRGKGGGIFAKDHATGQTVNALGLLKQVINGDWKETLEEARRICGVTYVTPVVKKEKPKEPDLSSNYDIEGTETFKYLNEKRGLSLETIKRYRVNIHVRRSQFNSFFWSANFWDSQGEFVFMKSTGINKKENGRKDIWSTTPYSTLWGWWLTDKDTKEIIISEGEIDAMSCYELGVRIPCLSIPSGVSNLSFIENDFNRLEDFEHIYIMMDNDEPGNQASMKIAKRLGTKRCSIVKLPECCNDVNDFLLKKEKLDIDFMHLINTSESIESQRILRTSDIDKKLKKEIQRFNEERSHNPFMWPEIPFRWRPGELSVIGGYTGHGKSQWVYQNILHETIMNNRKTCIASFEIPPSAMLFNIFWIKNGSTPNESNYKKEISEFQDRLWLIEGNEDHNYSWEMLKDDFIYANRRYGCDLFVIDALMHLTKKEDYAAQESVAKQAAKFCIQNDVSILLICHCDAKKYSSSNVPEPEHVLGGQGVVSSAHNVCVVWRNKSKERKMEEGDMSVESDSDAKLYIPKQRSTGNTVFRELWFDKNQRKFKTEKPRMRLPSETEDQEYGFF